MKRPALIACILFLLAGCDGEDLGSQAELALDPQLQFGKGIWEGTCAGCHAKGFAGAPVAGDAAAWMPRIAKGREVLYDHAINGFFGPGYTQMPARGGNAALTDDEVKAAVDYMLSLVE